ncbi:MAG: 3-phosphoshikimate 1-carboxyvinyltransferase [Chloroflexi bacterium]|nr:3-phosphoshikimate 1-carboxyvinyltransferase [Chloroflexota bacterium]
MVAAPTRPTAPTRVPPARRARGTVHLPGDKSVSHRAVLCNALADGSATVTNFSSGADCAATLRCLVQLGCAIDVDDSVVHVQGLGLGGLREPADVLDCGNSGTSLRLLSGILAGAGIFALLSGDGSLRRRPMARVVEPLRVMGAHIDGRDRGRLPPLAIGPVERLRGADHRLAVASAQVKSALLLAGLRADGPTTIVEPASTRNHTELLLRAMGASVEADGRQVRLNPVERLQAIDIAVPGDISSAAFWLTLACLVPESEVRVRRVGLNPTRTGFLTILQRMGAEVELTGVHDVAGEAVGDVVARTSRLYGTTVDGALIPLAIDELPLVALLGLFAEGETIVRDAAELHVKESDRIAAVAEGLTALGGDLTPTADGWVVRGGARLHSARVSSYGDHRLAMLFALAGSVAEGVEIDGAAAVDVSYPGFWATLAELTA